MLACEFDPRTFDIGQLDFGLFPGSMMSDLLNPLDSPCPMLLTTILPGFGLDLLDKPWSVKPLREALRATATTILRILGGYVGSQ